MGEEGKPESLCGDGISRNLPFLPRLPMIFTHPEVEGQGQICLCAKNKRIPQSRIFEPGYAVSYSLLPIPCFSEEPQIEHRKQQAAYGELEPNGSVRWREEALQQAGDHQQGNDAADQPRGFEIGRA